jgi:hypothetical protein
METKLRILEKVTRTIDGQVFTGVVIMVYEDYVLVRWDNGVVAVIDEPCVKSEKTKLELVA